jgi:ATP-dependent DNA helicase DinG
MRLEDNALAEQRDELEAWQMASAACTCAPSVLTLWQHFAADGSTEEPPRARWLSRRDGDEPLAVDFHCSHILAARILDEQLWQRAAAAILTSATMTALAASTGFACVPGFPTRRAPRWWPAPSTTARHAAGAGDAQ